MQDLGMYCLCYVGSEPKRDQFNQQNIMCGAINYRLADVIAMQQRGFIMDYTGDNISYLNKDFGSLTGIYWVWKNADHEYLGTNTYRLFWDEPLELRPNRIYVPKPIDVATAVIGQLPNPDIITHFNYCHDPMGRSWQLLREYSGYPTSKIQNFMIDSLSQHRHIVPYHMFTSDAKTFNRISEIMFDILFEYNTKYSVNIQELYAQTGQIRFFDFFSERIFHIICANIYYFFGNVDVIHLNLETFNHKA